MLFQNSDCFSYPQYSLSFFTLFLRQALTRQNVASPGPVSGSHRIIGLLPTLSCPNPIRQLFSPTTTTATTDNLALPQPKLPHLPPPPTMSPPALSPVALPRPNLHDTELLVPVLECALTNIIAAGDATAKSLAPTSPFHAHVPPAIPPHDYLRRLVRYSFCSRSAFVAAFLYLDDIAPSIPVTSLTVHRLLVTAVLLATKSFDDVLYDNAHFAKVGGLDTAELNALELDFLARRKFMMHVARERFFAFEDTLVAQALATRGGGDRNLKYSLWRAGFATERIDEREIVHTKRQDPGSPASVMAVSVFDAPREERREAPREERRRGIVAGGWRR